jgi:hypothetical protein
MAQALMNLGYLYLKACCIACIFRAESALYFDNLQHDLFRALPGECTPASRFSSAIVDMSSRVRFTYTRNSRATS